MARADRLSRLIDKWQADRNKLRDIADYFRDHGAPDCANIADFGQRIMERCIEDFQRANYPLDHAASSGEPQDNRLESQS